MHFLPNLRLPSLMVPFSWPILRLASICGTIRGYLPISPAQTERARQMRKLKNEKKAFAARKPSKTPPRGFNMLSSRPHRGQAAQKDKYKKSKTKKGICCEEASG